MCALSAGSLKQIRCAADIIRSSQLGVALTGAGISTPSGIPDFRSLNSGLWERFDPFEVASLTAFRYDPVKFYTWIRSLAFDIRSALPNPAHHALARLQETGFINTIVTQNIDGLHQRAGADHVLEVHGTLSSLTCGRCYQKVEAAQYEAAYFDQSEVPACPQAGCTGVLKPDVVLFGEQLPSHVWLDAMRACKTCDLMIVAGSSLEVLPVAGLPMRALENGARLIIVNNSQTYLDIRADVVFHDDVVDILPALAREVLGD